MVYRLPAIIISLTVIFLFRPVVTYSYNLIGEEEYRALKNLKTIFDQDTGKEVSEDLVSGTIFPGDATMIVMDIQQNWGKWSPEFRRIAGGYFLKKPPITPSPLPLSPVGRGEDATLPKGANLSSGKSVNGGHLLPNWVETANFNIEWGNGLNSDDGGKDSVRVLDCSKRLLGLPCTGIPDIVDSWADYFEEAWEKEIVELGYVSPTGTGTYLYDIYIANSADGTPGNNDDQTPSLGYNFWGITATYCDYENFNPVCKDDVSNSYSYIMVNGNLRDPGTMMVTAAHELFHAIQFSYPTIDNWFSIEKRWWIEATATWMEEVVYDDINSYYSRIRSWLKNPYLSLKYSGNRYTDHEYGDAIFIIFITDIYLRDQNFSRNFVKYVWEDEDSGIETIDSVLKDIYNMPGLESAFKEFVALNAVADIGVERGGYEEGTQYGRVAVTKMHDQYPVPLTTVAGEVAPQELGSNYIRFFPPDNENHTLVIGFDGSDGINWAAILVKVMSDGTGYDKEEIALASPLRYGCLAIEGFGTTYSEVFLVSAILVDPAVSESAPYSYKAFLDGYCDSAEYAYLAQNEGTNAVADNSPEDRRCFIATAAFGSSKSPFVEILREFRDRYLIHYTMGRRLVSLYYTVSPYLAEFIEHYPPAPFIVRMFLFPFIGIAFLFIKISLLGKLLLIGILLVSQKLTK